MALKDLYYRMEDKYYALLDWLDKKGINLYPIVDAIESKNIPSFPIMLLILILIIIAAVFLVSFLIFPAQAGVIFLVQDASDTTALEGAKITVSAAGNSLNFFTADNGEKEIFIPLGSADITVSKEGYKTQTKTITVSAGMDKQIFNMLIAAQMLSRTIQIMNDRTSSLLLQPVSIDLSCSNSEADYAETKTTSNGKIDIQVPENCGNLIAVPSAGFTSTQNSLDITETTMQLFLDAAVTEKGTVNAIIKDSQGNAVVGATVQLLTASGMPQGEEYSTSSGTVAFANIPTGNYFIVVHAQNFAEYDGSPDKKELAANSTITFNVTMQKATTGKIKVLVKDSASKSPVQNATVRLKQNSTVLDSKYTDSAGLAEFDAVQGALYSLEIDHPQYLLATVNSVSPADSVNEIFLEASTPSNSNTLYVTVLDTLGNPVESAKLALKKSDGKTLGGTKATGTDGKAEFANLSFDTYTVFAEKKGFTGKESAPITLTARQKNTVTIVLDIGYGKINVAVKDSDGNPVSGASVKAINIWDAKTETEQTTGAEGTAELEVRADKIVYLKAEAEGYLPYNTASIVPDPGSTVSKEIILIKDVSKLEVELKLFLNNETVSGSVTEGQKYNALVLLKIPKKTSFGAAGIHLRTGTSQSGKTTTMNEDNIYIKNVSASARGIVKGTSYTPDNGYATDSASLTSGDAKWANVEWRNAEGGVYEVEAEIQVRDTALLGEVLQVWYRGFGRSGNYVRFPVDKELGSSESSVNKQALYANANLASFTVGPSNLCSGFFCKSYTIEELSTGTKTSVVSEFPATVGNSYRLSFTVSNNSEQEFGNAILKISNETGAVKFFDYTIRDAFGVESKGTVNDYLLEKEIGTMQKNSVVFGNIVFLAEKDGANPIDISISTDNGKVFSDSIVVNVEAAKEMQISLLPKIIVPLIDNELLVKVSENETGIREAIVTIYLNGNSLFSGKTNANGELNYKLQAPAAGGVLRITASKPGYKQAEISQQITNEILLATPPQITETLSAAEFEKDIGVRLSNATQIPLQISSLAVNNLSQENLIEFFFSEGAIGTQIPVDSDMNFFLTARLTEKGLLQSRPITIKGNLAIEATNQDTKKTFAKNIPMQIRIALGSSVDSADCLSIEPVKWVITTGTKKQSLEATLTNSCTVGGAAIALQNLQAKTDWKDATENGSFEITDSSSNETEKTVIGTEFTSVLPLLAAGEELTLTMQFSPEQLAASQAMPEIIFQATNPTEQKLEKISVSLETETNVNNLADCVKITPTEIQVYPAAFNTGYNQYNSFGYNPTANSGYGTGTNSGYLSTTGTGTAGTPAGYGTTGTGGGYLSGTTPSYPNAQANLPFQSRYFDNAAAGSFSSGLSQSAFQIENTCTVPVEISLEAEQNLQLAKNKLSLDAGQSDSVKVDAGYLLGLFSIKVKAKAKGSKENPSNIAEILATVLRPEEISDDCIDLQPTRISLNSFYGAPQPARIYNYCYHLGVSLQKTSKIVEFACRVPGTNTGTGMFSGQQETKTGTLLFQTMPQNIGTPYDPATGYTGVNGPVSGGGYINSTPQPYVPATTPLNVYPGAAPQNPGYSPNEQYVPNGTSAPFGQGYYNQTQPNAGLFYPGTTSGYIGGAQGGNMGGAFPNGSNGWNYASSGGYEGACPLIDSIYINSDKKFPEGNGITQVVEFDVTPNMQYRQQLCNNSNNNLPYETAFGLRMASMGSYYRSNVSSSAQVHYNTPAGTQTAYFRVSFEDLWGMGESIDACMRNALQRNPQGLAGQGIPVLPGPLITPNVPPQQCIKQDALDVQALFSSVLPNYKGFIPSENSYWQGQKYEFLNPSNPVMIINQANACGLSDELTLNKTTYEDSKGVNLSFALTPDKHNVKMTVERTGRMTMQCAKIETTLLVGVRRPVYFASAPEFPVKVKVWVLHEGITADNLNEPNFVNNCETTEYKAGTVIPPVGTAGLEACKADETGMDTYHAYGFDRLLWNWDWDSVQAKTCDETIEGKTTPNAGNGGMFCDAAQFGIALNQKGKKILEYVNTNKAELEKNQGIVVTALELSAPAGSQQTNEALNAINTADKAKSHQNTAELFRWALEQTPIEDIALETDSNPKIEHAVFNDSTGNDLVSLDFKANEEILKQVFAGNEYENIKTKFNAVKGASDQKAIVAAITDLQDSFVETSGKLKYPVYVLLEIDLTKFDQSLSGSDLTTLGHLGLIKGEQKTTEGKFVKGYLTLADYAKLQKNLVAAAEGTTDEGTCYASSESTDEKYFTNDLSKALVCYIVEIDQKLPGIVPVSLDLLNSILVNSKFKLIAVDNDKLNMEKNSLLLEWVMQKGKMRAAPAGYDNLLKFYKENIDVNAFLIKDNYSQAFQTNFASYYADKGLTGKGISDFGKTEKLAFSAKPSMPLQESGKYKVLLNYNWSKTNWDINFSLLDNMQKIASYYGEKIPSNTFLSAPIDGKMAEQNSDRDYGIGFANGAAQLPLVKPASADTPINSTTGNGSIAATLDNTYNATKTGTILEISTAAWKFSPSWPAKITMELTPNSAGKAIVLYNWTTETQAQQADLPLLKWASEKAASEKLILPADGQACDPGINTNWFGLNETGMKSATTFIAAGFFPSSAASYSLKAVCANAKATISSGGKSISVVPGVKTETLLISPAAGLAGGTIKDYLEKIKEKTACVVTSPAAAGAMTIKWNPAEAAK
ncbi:MAG TPA: carboxypeptidase regulatory-like domain-containing protein [archaeon]|nr:carboxypeptidase regulatory-like domain-containing protein [archaeon]